jgi:cytochrome d ubiquinol oxidase subunit I
MVDLARLDFAWITTMHIIYPPLTIGLAAFLFYSEVKWLRTNSDEWYRLTRFFEKLFVINFGAGVATGITMEMSFGILFGPFSQAAGPFFGNILGYETITAFMYEAGFIGLMVFGWGKISKKMHLFATFNVAFSSMLSAMWILVANSWMQSPTGVHLENGLFLVDSWKDAILNPSVLTSFPHMLIAAIEIGLFFVAGISAWMVYKKKPQAKMFMKTLTASLMALVIVAPLQIYVGDELGRTVAEHDPAALAAMEGHWHTYNKDGTPNTSWNVIAWPNEAKGTNDFQIGIPHMLSLLEDHQWVSPVKGLEEFKPEDRPPVLLPFYAFRIMVAAGGLLMIIAFWALFLKYRNQFTVEGLQRRPWFLRLVIFSAILPYIAIWTGWWTREVARQPWIVHGLMRTSEGVSQMSITAEVVWFIGFVVFDLLVWVGAWYFFAKVVRTGPDMQSPVIHETENLPLGALPHDKSQPESILIRPTA